MEEKTFNFDLLDFSHLDSCHEYKSIKEDMLHDMKILKSGENTRFLKMYNAVFTMVKLLCKKYIGKTAWNKITEEIPATCFQVGLYCLYKSGFISTNSVEIYSDILVERKVIYSDEFANFIALYKETFFFVNQYMKDENPVKVQKLKQTINLCLQIPEEANNYFS